MSRVMGPVTAIDVATSGGDRAVGGVERAWVEGAWTAWQRHHLVIQTAAGGLVSRMG